MSYIKRWVEAGNPWPPKNPIERFVATIVLAIAFILWARG